MMNTWKAFAAAEPELAAFGAQRLGGGVAYLATVKADGSPRLHPVTPIVGEEQLFLFMEPTSPKGHDLRRDGRYALHCAVRDSEGGEGEFLVSGQATFVEDPSLRAEAVRSASYTPQERYILFTLSIESAQATVYGESGPVRRRWKKK
jgi:hypothetical protein